MRGAGIADHHAFALPLDRRVHTGSAWLAKHEMACGGTPNGALASVGELESFAEPRPFNDAHARTPSADLHRGVHRVECNHAGRATGVKVDFNGHFHVHGAKPQLMSWADDAWFTRPKLNPSDEAQASAFTIDDEPVIFATLDAYARGTNTWVIDDGIAVGRAAYLDPFVFEGEASLGGDGTSLGNDKNETHGSSQARPNLIIRLCDTEPRYVGHQGDINE